MHFEEEEKEELENRRRRRRTMKQGFVRETEAGREKEREPVGFNGSVLLKHFHSETGICYKHLFSSLPEKNH